MSQKDIATELGVSFSLVSQWERGICTPNPDMLETIADIFGISINELLGSYAPQQLKDLSVFRGFPLDRYVALSAADRDIIGQYVETMIDLLDRKAKKAGRPK